MAEVTIYLGAGVGTYDSVLDYKVDYIDDKQVNKATFKVYDYLEVQSGDIISFYDNNSVLQFKGKCKEVNPLDGDDTGVSELICYTLEIELTERTVTEVFLSQTLEDFIESIVITYSSLNFATTLTTGVTVDYYLADKKPAFDLVKDLLNRSDELTYYINYTTSTFHLVRKGDTESSTTLIQRNNAVFESGWKGISDKQCTVLNLTGGKEARYGFSESFNGTGAQTTFTMSNIFSNMKILVGGTEQTLEVSGQNTGDFTVIPKDKLVIFNSGSIPGSGTDNIVVTYDYEIPIDLTGIQADPELITQYGIIERTITRNHLKSINDALDYGYEYVNRWAKPVYGNTARIISSVNASLYIPGNKIFVQDTDHKIDGSTVNQFFIIKQVSYSQEGLIITVGEIRSNMTDFITELKYNINQLEASNTNSSVISKSYFLNDNVNIVATDELELQLVQELPDNAIYYFDQDGGSADTSNINNGEERPYSSNITGLLLWLKFDDNILDYSGNGYTGTWNGTPAYELGNQFNLAIDCSGANYVSNSNTIIGVQTISFFMNLDANNTDLIDLTASAKISINGSSEITTTGLSNVTIYVDNVNTITAGLSSYKLILITFDSISADTFKAGDGSNGRISDVRLYDSKLSSNERTRIYNSGSGIVDNAINEDGGVLQSIHYEFSDENIHNINPDNEIANLQGYYSMNGDSVDGSGNGNDGTDTDISYVTGKIGQAASFNGTTSNITCGDSPFDFGTGAFTLMCWVNTNSTTAGSIIAKRLGISGDGYRIGIISNTFFFGVDTGGSEVKIQTGTISASTWYHLAAVHTGSRMFLYLDGELVSTLSKTGDTDNSAQLTIGNDSLSGFLDGLVDDVLVIGRSITTDEVVARYNSGNGKSDRYGSWETIE